MRQPKLPGEAMALHYQNDRRDRKSNDDAAPVAEPNNRIDDVCHSRQKDHARDWCCQECIWEFINEWGDETETG